MKLMMKSQDADLALRFSISRATVSNIFQTLLCGVMVQTQFHPQQLVVQMFAHLVVD